MSSNQVTCGECGTVNNALSLFCAECGASLHPEQDASPTSSGQTTAAFTPPVRSEPVSGTGGLPSTSDRLPIPGLSDRAVARSYAPGESRRGLFLGVLAGILIFAVFALFAWSQVVGDDIRNTLSGLI